MNGLLKEDRVIVDDLAGTTRDSVHVNWIYQGRRVVLVDNAGINPKQKGKKQDIEKMVH